MDKIIVLIHSKLKDLNLYCTELASLPSEERVSAFFVSCAIERSTFHVCLATFVDGVTHCRKESIFSKAWTEGTITKYRLAWVLNLNC